MWNLYASVGTTFSANTGKKGNACHLWGCRQAHRLISSHWLDPRVHGVICSRPPVTWLGCADRNRPEMPGLSHVTGGRLQMTPCTLRSNQWLDTVPIFPRSRYFSKLTWIDLKIPIMSWSYTSIVLLHVISLASIGPTALQNILSST